MHKKECVAMLLAGGEGRRLGALTEQLAKPAVHYGGKYRIIDFTLSNCTNSGIDTVGVLTQYQPHMLNRYIGIGCPWDLDRQEGGVAVLPPYVNAQGGDWYSGTANAIYQNIGFIEQFDPELLLVISGDHIYKMDYDWMIHFHREKKAEASIAVIEVSWEEASRFGIMETDSTGRIISFTEKPKQPTSNLASMGVYMFSWPVLREYLLKDANDPYSSNDFGKDVIPRMLREKVRLYAYRFGGYWKDVGTIDSLWQANMDLLENPPLFNLNDHGWRIYSQNPNQPAQYIAHGASVHNALLNEGCVIYGNVEHSVLFYGVFAAEGSHIIDSVIMPGVQIGSGAVIRRAIIGEGATIGEGCQVGSEDGPITLIRSGAVIEHTEGEGVKVG